MSFIQNTEKSKVVTPTAMALSPDKKHLAVCETAEDDISNLNFQSMITGAPLSSLQPAVPQVCIKLRFLHYFYCYLFLTDKHLQCHEPQKNKNTSKTVRCF